MIQPADRRDLALGSIVGLALGNALGVECEHPRETLPEKIYGFSGGGPFGLEPGEWSAETSLAMCVAESLLENHAFDGEDIAQRLSNWYEHGYWSTRDFGFGLKASTRQLLASRQTDPRSKEHRDETEPLFDGACLPMVGPLVLYFLQDYESAYLHTASLFQKLYDSQELLAYATLWTETVYFALYAASREELFERIRERLNPASGIHLDEQVCDYLSQSCQNKPDYQHHDPKTYSEILASVFWALANAHHFKEGLLNVVNLRGKSSITGALYGQLAGAHFGAQGIPENWLRLLKQRNALQSISERLWHASIS